MSQYENAQIDYAKLGLEDHGIFTVSIGLKLGVSSHIGFGGYALDEYKPGVETAGRRMDKTGMGTEFIKKVLDTVGVEDWSELKGKYVHIEREDGWNGKVTGIRNILDEDKWFRPEQWFEENYG